MKNIQDIIESAAAKNETVLINSVENAFFVPSPTGPVIVLRDLYWKKDGEIYQCVLQSKIRNGFIGYYVVGSVDGNVYTSGDTSMFQKKYRWNIEPDVDELRTIMEPILEKDKRGWR